MAYLYVKALHIIFIVTWFAGLFYIVRIFIYQAEANERPEEERRVLVPEYKRNAMRLWKGITWPSAILTLIFGTWLLYLQPDYLKQGFMHVKLTLVVLLYVYHFICHRMYLRLQRDVYEHSSQKLRFWNEVATLLLFAIVFVIVLRSSLDMMWGMIWFVVLSLVLYVAIIIYKKVRNKNEKTPSP
jgi:protoporphyrinogen IX oxidase